MGNIVRQPEVGEVSADAMERLAVIAAAVGHVLAITGDN